MSAAFPVGIVPGHYILLYHNNAISTASSITGNANFKGVCYQTDWRTMEPVKNNYSQGITLVQSWIDWIDANQPGNKLIVTIEWNTFSASDRRVPEYIRNTAHADYDPAYDPSVIGTGGVSTNTVGGECAKIWNDAVRARMKACYLAIYNAFKDNPTFSGLYTAESAQALTTPNDRTSSAFRAGWQDFMDIKSSMPDKMLFAAFNFLTGESAANFRTVLEYGANLGVAIGCPDIRIGVDVVGADTSTNVAVKVGRESSQRIGSGITAVGPKHEQALGSNPSYATMMSEFRNTYGGDFAFWRRIQLSSDPNQQNFNPYGLAAVAADVAANPYPWAWGEAQSGGGSASNITVTQDRVALNTSTGNQALVHASADPFFALIRTTGATADATYSGTLRSGLGITDGTRQVSMAWHSSNGSTIGTQFGGSRGATDTMWVQTVSGALTVDGEASFVSWDDDDLTVNISDAPASAFLAHYLVMGGTDGSSYVNKLSLTSQDTEATLTHSLGDDGPNLIIVFSGAGAIDDASDNNYRFSFGIATFDGATITQRGYIEGETNSTNPSAVGSYLTNIYVGGNCAGAGSPTSLFEVTSVDGTSIGITPRTGDANVDVMVACIKLDNATANIFDMTLPTATGDVSHSVGVDASYVLALLSMATAYNTAYANSQAGAFAITSINATNQFCNGFTVQDNRTTTSITKAKTDDQAIVMGDHSGSSGASNSFAATFTSFADNNLNLNYTAVHTTGGIGFGVAIEVSAADTTDPTTPGQPSAPTVTETTAATTWTASTDAGSGLQQYYAYLNSVRWPTQSPIITNSVTLTGLPSGTTYNSPGLQISAIDNAGNESALSTARTFSTSSPVDNSAATFAGVATAVGDDTARTITITWPQAVDAITPNAQMRYRVYDDSTEVGVGTTLIETTTAGVLGTVINDAATGDHWINVKSLDSSDNADTNNVTINVVMSDISGTFEITTSRPLKLSTNTILTNTDVDCSWVVNGPAGYLGAATITDLGTLTTDSSGYLSDIEVPGPERGTLHAKREVNGVTQKWEEAITPVAV